MSHALDLPAQAEAPPRPSRLPAAFWAGLEAGISALLSSLSAFGIARLVGPAELGIAAAVLAPHVLLWIATNALFADAIVQRASLSTDEAASAVRAACLAGGLAALAQIATGPALVAVFADARLLPMAALLALPLPLVGLGGAMQGLLNRRRDFRALAGRAVLGQGAGTLVGLGLAWYGAGAWAMVAQQAVTSTVGALVLLWRAGGLPRGRFHLAAVRSLLATGLPLTASTLALHARYRVFALLIGASAGPAVLGEVHLAFRLVDTVRDLASTALWRLLLPAMAECQDDLARLRLGVDRAARSATLVLVGLCAAMALAVRPLVALLLGPRWQGVALAAVPLCGLAAWQFMAFAGGVAAVARGHARAALGVNLLALTAAVLAVGLLHPANAPAAALAWVGAAALTAPLGLGIAARALAWPLARSLRAALAAALLALAGAAAAMLADWVGSTAMLADWVGSKAMLADAAAAPMIGPHAPARLALRLVVFAALYLPGAVWLWRRALPQEAVRQD